MKKIKRYTLLISEIIKREGWLGLIKHCVEKSIWLFQKHTFKCVGSHTFVQPPFIITGGKYIQMGDYVTIRKRLQLEAIDFHNDTCFTPEIIIGNHVSINYDVHIGAINKVIIEDGVLIASKVFITDHGHGKATVNDMEIPPQERILYSKGIVHIKKNAWIGEGVTILPNVTIGENCIVGANAVVTKSFPDNCIIAGNPARIIKKG